MSLLDSNDFKEVCRACTLKKNDLTTIYTGGLIEMYNTLIQIQIHQNDGLPQMICCECLSEIKRLNTFKELCVRSDSFFRKILNGENEKKSTDSQVQPLQSVDIKSEYEEVDEKKDKAPEVKKTVVESDNDDADDSYQNDIKEECSSEEDIPLKMLSLPKSKRKRKTTRSQTKIDNVQNELKTVRDKSDGSMHAETEKDTPSDESCSTKNSDAKSKKKRETVSESIVKKMLSMGPDKCDPVTFTCKICNKVLVNIKSLAQHMELHDENRKFKFTCNICDKGCYDKGQLTKHMRRHKKETRYKCEECSKGFYELSALAVHMKSNHKTKPMSCDTCNKEFYVQLQLDTHKKTHLAKKERICNQCGETFHKLSLFRKHLVIHPIDTWHPCLSCDKIFKHAASLRRHQQTFHDGNEIKPKICPICGKAVKFLHGHIVHAHSEERPYKCADCPAAFFYNSELKLHRQAKHDKIRKYPYLCSTCGKPCPTAYELKRHTIQRHSEERPFQCPHCDKKYKRSDQLKVHVRSHTSERPHVCPFCNKGFYTSQILKYHVRTHTGERPHECEVCGRAFTQLWALKTHMKMH